MVQSPGDEVVSRRQNFAIDSECLAIRPLGTRRVTLEKEQRAQVGPAARDVLVLVPEQLPVQVQGPAKQRLRRTVVSPVANDSTQVGERAQGSDGDPPRGSP